MKHVHGPDFPTGGILYGRSGIVDAYRTGRGRFLMRARVAIENVTKDRQALIVTELPYQVNKSMLFKRISELVENKIISDIDISTEWTRDESDRDGMRMVIGLKRGAQPEIVLNQLYKHTQLQESFSMIFLAVINGQPKELGLAEAIQVFIDHRIDVVQRRTVYLLRKAREREHILEGYKIALDNLDTVIKIIRGSSFARRGPRKPLRLGQGQLKSSSSSTASFCATKNAASPCARSTPSSNCSSIASPNSRSTKFSTSSKKFASKSPTTKRSWAARKSCARSSSKSLKRFATGTATSGALRSLTKAPSCSLKT